MESTGSSVSAAVVGSVRDGTFISDEDTLISSVSQDAVSEILNAITTARDDLRKSICQTSRGEAADIDDWITQAKQVQEDIANCKSMAREIVQDYEGGRGLEASVADAQAKTDLLSEELHFSTALQQELEDIDYINGVLGRLEDDVSGARFTEAAEGIGSLQISLNERRASGVNAIFEDRRKRLAAKCYLGLQDMLFERLRFRREGSSSSLEILTDASEPSRPDSNAMLDALNQLGVVETLADAIRDRIEAYIVRRLLMYKPKACVSVTADDGKLVLQTGEERPSAEVVLNHTKIVLRYLHKNLPNTLKPSIISQIVPDIVTAIINEHLIDSVPFELDKIHNLKGLQQQVQSLVDLLRSYNWPYYPPLVEWISRAPRFWLSRRKQEALQGVRTIFRTPRGPTQQVERIETERIPKQGATEHGDGATSSRQLYYNSQATPAEDDSSAWDFDEEAESNEEDQQKLNGTSNTGDEDTEADWGWNDEVETTSSGPSMHSTKARLEMNGHQQTHSSEQELSLKETYTITDIPAHLLDIIRHDITDAQLVSAPRYSILSSVSPSQGLLNLPALVLTMFRAVAPAYYSEKLTSGNMHLYNDSIHIIQKVREINPSQKNNDLETQCRVMDKFAKGAYAREMDTQRIILGDLLDGAQGFVNCTQQPHMSECENAVAAVIDRIRAVHESWKPVLSSSTSMQAVGSLLSTVIGKIVQDIEDMDDISEPQSQRLSGWFHRIKSLDDIFIAPHLDAAATVEGRDANEVTGDVPQTMMYCPNWLKFNYLIDILDSSLEDIKFLWTNGMLGFEYDRDEVIDLVKALFSDSIHRRNFVTEIRRLEPGAQFQH